MSAIIPAMATWQRCTDCSGSAQPGARALLAAWLEFDPLAASMGIYNCRPVRGSSLLSVHSCGRAVDCAVPVNGTGHAVMRRFLAALAPHAKALGIQLIIFDRRVWSAKRPPTGSRYGGVHPHRDHAHIELNRAAAQRLTLATIRSKIGRAIEEDDVLKRGDNGPQVAYLQRRINDSFEADGNLDGRIAQDGVFGPATETAVKQIQDNVGFEQTGVADMMTAIYIQALAHSKQPHSTGGGLSQSEADGRYVRRGATIKLP